jgi:hypothetical protein
MPALQATENWRENFDIVSSSAFGMPSAFMYKSDIFMLMPFEGDVIQETYQEHVVKVARELNMSIKRADDFFSNGIVNEIWAAINAATC